MEKFMQFVVNHWWLWLALVLVLGLLIFEELKDRLQGLQRLSASELTQMLNHEEAVVVDIRDKAAFSQGHILGAINIPGNQLMQQIAQLANSKNKAIVIVDGNGQQVSVGAKLRPQGFKVCYLQGGINGWRQAGLPLTKKE